MPIKGLKCRPCGSRLVRVIRLVKDRGGKLTYLDAECSTCGYQWYSRSKHALRHHVDNLKRDEQR